MTKAYEVLAKLKLQKGVPTLREVCGELSLRGVGVFHYY
jgi:hypothetical protein